MQTGRHSRRLAVFRLLWLAAVVAVVTGSLIPTDSAPIRMLGWLHVSDKVLHFCAYAALAFLPVLYERFRAALVIAVCLAALSILVEFGQTYTKTRLFEMADIAANGGGVLCGLLAGLPRRFY